MEVRQTPLILTQTELKIFNEFWQSISEDDRHILEDLLASTDYPTGSLNREGTSLPYEAVLLALLIQEHREVLRLRGLIH